MKKMIILVATVFAFSAQAKSTKIKLQKCGLPSATHELDEVGANELFYINAGKQELTDVEIEMVREIVYNEDDRGDIIADFASAEGGITYFTLNHKLYAHVNSYPGDNEFGAIFKISKVRTGDYESVASINDGEIDCH